jgi:hypothetical protein
VSDPTPRSRSLLEFSVIFAVIGTISWFGLNGLAELQELGEKTAVEMTMRNVQTGLRYAMAGHFARGEDVRIVEMVGSNPVQWLEKPPAGYQGECPVPIQLPAGGWCFDAKQRELLYRPTVARNLVIEGGGQILHWSIKAVRGSNRTDQVESVRVAPVIWFRWFGSGGA